MLYLLPFLISTAISLGVGIYCWRHRTETGALMYALVAFSQASWTFGYIFELLNSSLESKIFWDNFQFIGGVGWVVAFVAFTLEYTGRRVSRPGLIYGVLSIPGIAIVLLAFTDPLHGLVRSQTRIIPGEPFSALLYDITLSDLIWGIYSYGVFLVCIAMLVIKYARSHPLYRTQVGLILAGNLLPLIGIALTLIGVIQGPYRDISPFTFAIGNLIVAWGLFRYGLFNIVPLAWDKVIENMSDAVIVLDAQSRVVNLNPTARRIANRENAAAIGRPASQVFAKWPEIVRQYQEVEEARVEIEVNTTVGPRHIELRIQPLYDQRHRFKGRVVIARDITDRKLAEDELIQHRNHLEDLVRERTAKLVAANQQLRQQIIERERLEEQFRQSQKMEAVGHLAGGIAHDFNNILIPIIGYVELAMMNIAPDDKLYADMKRVREAADRAASLTHQILAFSRKQMLEMRVLDLNAVVVDFKKMIHRLIGEDIELRTFLDDDLYWIKADQGQIEQILMNLAVNARDAMPVGGKLTIETANVYLDEAYVKKYVDTLSPGHYAMLSVSDTGHGMGAETQQQIFEPFFTTKKQGKGTGLGLATVFGIVKQHGGNIWVYSEPGKGTTFKIYLPQTPEGEHSVEISQVEPGSLSGTETILVVEDEEMVRHFICETLAAYGYQVIEAQNGNEGLQCVAEYKETIHLLLTDVVMPEMNGRELYQNIASIYPDVKVLYMSGYTDNVIVHHGILEEGLNFLQKPFTVQRLTRKIRQVLS